MDQRRLGLVALQGADEDEVQAGGLGDLGEGLLHVVLPEAGEAQVRGLPHQVKGLAL